MRTIVRRLRRKLGDAGGNPTYIFTEPRVGYRMPKGDAEPLRRFLLKWGGLVPDSGDSREQS